MRNVTARLTLLASSLLFLPPLPRAAGPDNSAGTIEASACSAIQAKIGQLLYLSVDGFGYEGAEAIHPEYVKVVEEIQPGGVLPRFVKDDYDALRSSVSALQNAAKEPLLIGVDYANFRFKNVQQQVRTAGVQTEGREVTFGQGYGGGRIGDFQPKGDKACYARLAYLDAFLHRALGLNQALGPTLERNRNWGFLDNPPDKVMSVAESFFKSFRGFGVATTMKHFPYTPETFNLHEDNKDNRVPSDKVKAGLGIFKKAAPHADFAMSTHILNTNIDREDMATFSGTWVRMLRKEVGFDGLLMTDALFMIDSFPETLKAMARKWDAAQAGGIESRTVIFAVRAILAGHDMVLLDGTADKHRRVFRDLKTIACLDTALGAAFRARIEESHARIKAYKDKHAKSLRGGSFDVPQTLADEAGGLYGAIVFSTFAGLPCPYARFEEFQAKLKSAGLSGEWAPAAVPSNEGIPHCVPKQDSTKPLMSPGWIGPLYKVQERFEDHLGVE